MKKNKILAILCPLAFLLFGIWIVIESSTFRGTDGTFPKMAGVLMIAVSLIQLIKDFCAKEHKNKFEGGNNIRVLEYVAALILYVFLIKKIGYVFDTLWLTAFTMFALGYKNWKGLVIYPVAITAILYLLFGVLLKVPLPTLWL